MNPEPTRQPGEGRNKRPPHLVEVLLEKCLPPGIVGNSILGDMREQFASDLTRLSPVRAKPGNVVLYWRSKNSATCGSVADAIPGASSPPMTTPHLSAAPGDFAEAVLGAIR